MYMEVHNNISNRLFHFLKAAENGNKNLNAPTRYIMYDTIW